MRRQITESVSSSQAFKDTDHVQQVRVNATVLMPSIFQKG